MPGAHEPVKTIRNEWVGRKQNCMTGWHANMVGPQAEPENQDKLAES